MFAPRIQSEDAFSNIVQFMPDQVLNNVRREEDMDIRSRINNQVQDKEFIHNNLTTDDIVLQETGLSNFEGEEVFSEFWKGVPTWDDLEQNIQDKINPVKTETQVEPDSKIKTFYEKNKTMVFVGIGAIAVIVGVIIYKKRK